MPSLDVSLLTGTGGHGHQRPVGNRRFAEELLKDGLEYGVAVLPKFKKAVTYNTGGPHRRSAPPARPSGRFEDLRQMDER